MFCVCSWVHYQLKHNHRCKGQKYFLQHSGTIIFFKTLGVCLRKICLEWVYRCGELITHSSAVHGFNTGYFASTSSCTTQARDIVPATDSCRYGSAMFNQFTKCPQIADSGSDLLRCIEASSTTSTIHGYWLHSHRFLHRSTELDFWKIQAAIVALFMLSGL